jgi:hypothetical protein
MKKISSDFILLTTIAVVPCTSNPRDDRARDPNPRPEVSRCMPAVPFYSNRYVLPQYLGRQYAVED